ncbi:hypothetical protein M0805_009105 [Coniferiporia weirii]|nr:hypothetical protein M0805_009105 [Coniferiporia weirii]
MSQPEVTPSSDQQFLRIKEIDIDFKGNRPNYPVSVKLEVNGEVTRKSPKFGKNEAVLWRFENNLHIPVPADLTLTVRVVHMFNRKKEFAIFNVASADIAGKHAFSAPDNDGKALVKVACEPVLPTDNFTELKLKEAGAALVSKKVILESLGKCEKAIDAVMEFTDLVSDVHPAAKAAMTVIKVLYDKVKQQRECHDSATELMQDLASFLPFVKDAPLDIVKDDRTRRTIKEMLELFNKISTFIITYSSEGFLGDLLSSHREEVDSSKNEFKRLKDSYDWCVKVETWKSAIEAGNRIEDAELRQLHLARQAYYNDERRCLVGTRTTVLAQVVDWAESDSDSGVFWLHGVAGSGKSSIANSVAHMLKQQRRLPACFFCKRDDPDCRATKNVVPTLAYHLSKWHQDYRALLLSTIRGEGELELAQGLRRQLKLLIRQPLTSLSLDPTNILPPKPLVVVIDALDECGDSVESRRELAGLLMELAGIVPWLKVFITGRTLPEFQDVFLRNGVECKDLNISTLDGELVRRDILEYTIHCAKEYKVNITEEQTSAFAEKASGLFIWTSTVFKFISMQRRKQKAIEGILLPTPADTQEAELDQMYTAVVKNASVGLDNLQVVKAVLGVLFCTAKHRPLPEHALIHFITGLVEGINIEDIENTIDCLQSVLYRDESQGDIIRVCHPSFLDYIGNHSQSQEYWTEVSTLNSIMATRCLQIMISELRFNICNLESSYVFNDDVPDLQDRVKKYIPQHLQYSCLYWTNHLQSSCLKIDGQGVQDMLYSFLHNLRAIYWLECLSLMKELKAGIDILESFCKSYEASNQTVRVCRDLYRLVSAYYAGIANSTPHLYISALSWAPTESLVTTIFCKPYSIESLINTGNDKNWKATLWSAHAGGLIFCTAYSPDGKHIVSSSSSKDLRIWDVQNGNAVGDPLTGHLDDVWSVAYSPDGRYIVSGSHDETLRIWDAQTGDAVRDPLTGHSNAVFSVAYSPDGRYIVSGSGDNTLRIWDSQTGNAVRDPLTGHSSGVLSVAYSPDGRYIVSGSSDKTLRIWDAQNGDAVGDPLTGHSGDINSVAYSPDGRYIVSGSGDNTLRIWDTQINEAVGDPLTGHSDDVDSVAYSPDGRYIVSGSLDKTLRVWDAQIGDAVGVPLLDHSDFVTSVAYSPDGQYIVSGSWDNTLKVWDAQTGNSVGDPLAGHTDDLCSVVYSPDGKYIVSGSGDRTLRIWDAETGDAVGDPLTGHLDCVSSVAYSPDGSYIVSGSEDKTLRIWNAQTGNTVGDPLIGHLDSVSSIAYSPDGRYIVSGSGDNTLRIWDAQIWDAVGDPLTGHSEYVTSVAYSPNGKYIVSGSYDNTLF